VRINHRKDPFFNLNALRPRIKELNSDEPNIPVEIEDMTPQAIRRTISHQRHPTAGAYTTVSSPTNSGALKIPIAGYTGHRMAYRSQNFYGKNYRDCSIQSKLVQQMALNQ
jgi:hypothetical protein